MSDWNELENLENQLRYWTPRAPSAKVKARLFGTESTTAAEAVEAKAVAGRRWSRNGHPTWHWLAPAMAVFVLGLFVAGHNSGMGQGSGELFSMNEPERASFYMNNSVQIASFDWTNRGHSLTTPAPVAPTNSLFQ